MSMQPESKFETAQRAEKILPVTDRWEEWTNPILDIGGGDGAVWDWRSWETRNVPMDLVEPDEELRGKAYRRGVYRDIYKNVGEVDPGDYGAALCLGVLEHLDDYKGMIDFLFKFDRFYITVPNADSLHRHIGVSMGMLDRVDSLHEGDHSIGHERVWTFDEFANMVLDFNFAFNRNYDCEIGTVGFKFLDNNGMEPFLKNYHSLCQMAKREDFVGPNRKHGAEIYAYFEK